MSDATGGFFCPLCGKDTPHNHTPEERATLVPWNSAAKAERARRALKKGSDTQARCPFCNDSSTYTGDPAEVFCEHHYALYRKTGAA